MIALRNKVRNGLGNGLEPFSTIMSVAFLPMTDDTKNNGFTIIEVLVVVIIIGILVGLSLPGFTKTKEKALDREAKISLDLIQNAEKFVFMKNMEYYPLSGTVNLSAINANLQLALPESSSWNYTLTGSAGTDYTAVAERKITGPPYYRNCTVTSADTEAHCP